MFDEDPNEVVGWVESEGNLYANGESDRDRNR